VAVAGFAAELALRFARRSDNRSESDHEASPVLRQDCNPATTTPQALTYGKLVRAVASLGHFLGALVVQSIYHFDRPPVQGLVLQNTFIERCSLPVSEALSRLDHRTVGACPRPCGYGRDGATRKGVRTALYVF
jgi:hypothetical protein